MTAMIPPQKPGFMLPAEPTRQEARKRPEPK